MQLELVPARMVNEFVYCPRLFYLEWVHKEFAHSEDTLEGAAVHRRVDRETGTLPQPDDAAEEAPFQARSVLLSAPRLGLIARIDLLQGDGDAVRPVDYKKVRRASTGRGTPTEFSSARRRSFFGKMGTDVTKATSTMLPPSNVLPWRSTNRLCRRRWQRYASCAVWPPRLRRRHR